MITFPLAGLFEIALPVGLAIIILHRFRSNWKFVGIGALIFIASQVVHLPLLNGITWLFDQHIIAEPPAASRLLVQSLILGLAAGFCEETARLIGFSWIGAKNQRLGNFLALGIGHGGVESVLVGLSVLGSFLFMLIYRDPALEATIPGLADQAKVYWSVSWDIPLAGAVERVSALCIHLACTLLVAQTFVKHNGLYYGAALLWHALVDGITVYCSGVNLSTWSIEGVVAVLAGISVLLIYWTGRSIDRAEQLLPSGAGSGFQDAMDPFDESS